ncbi:MAG: response regulator [Thermodesulfobacteriota bacterium]
MQKGKILLVDDEAAFTASMAKLLRVRGYQVATAAGGKEAIQVLEAENFDVVVLDLKMPGMDGIATLNEIKKLKLHTETLILTGHGSIDSALDAFNLGAYDYLTKPCALEDLLNKIEGAGKKKDVAEKRESLDGMIRIKG